MEEETAQSADHDTPDNEEGIDIMMGEEKVDAVTNDIITPDGDKPPVPDGGFGWVVVAASFISVLTLGTTISGFSVLYVELADYFDESLGRIGWINSIYCATGNFLAFLFSPLVTRFGCRKMSIAGSLLSSTGILLSSALYDVPYMYFTYGLIAGLGNGIIFLTSIVIVQQYFDKRRTIACGLASAGGGAGTTISAPIVRLLLDTYGIRGALIMMAGIHLQSIWCGCLFFPVETWSKGKTRQSSRNAVQLEHETQFLDGKIPDENELITSKHSTENTPGNELTSKQSEEDTPKHLPFSKLVKQAFDFSLLRKKELVLMYVSALLMHFGIMTFYQHSVGRSIFVGLTRKMAALMLFIAGVVSVVSRMVYGLATNRLGNKTLQYSLVTLVSGVAVVFTGFMDSLESTIWIHVAFGVVTGPLFILMTLVLVELLGVANIARTQAFLNMFIGLGLLLSIPFGGFLFDISGSYVVPFTVCGGIQLLAALLGFVIVLIKKKKVPTATLR